MQASDTTGLVVVTQLQLISVLFTLPEDNVRQVQTPMAAGTLTVTAYDRTDTRPVATGTLATIGNQIDSTTGTVKLRAMFDNADDALFPQQFVNARLRVQTLKGVTVAPQAAVQTGEPGQFVYLVKPDNTVAIQVIKTGVAQGERMQVTEGPRPGDQVVVDGLDRLRDGAKITIAAPAGAAPADAAPASRRRKAAAGG